jgi:galactonate dehydratase
MAPHLYAGPVEWAANVHLAVSCPNALMVEAIESPFHEALVSGRPRVETGFVTAPDAPGLGIELNDDIAAAHPVSADRLHLEMQEAPCDWQNGNSFGGGAAD